MCGIWSYLIKSSKDFKSSATVDDESMEQEDVELFKTKSSDIENEMMKIQYRGPDSSYFKEVNENHYIGFHRLAIMDPTSKGNQPFVHEKDGHKVYIGCNGEIYNYYVIAKKYNIELETRSDCEILTHLYYEIGFEKMLNELWGVFGIVVYDYDKNNNLTVYAGTDRISVRPLFMAESENTLSFCSELKGINDLDETATVTRIRGGQYVKWESTKKVSALENLTTWYSLDYKHKDVKITKDYIEKCKRLVEQTLVDAVERRMTADRPVACLLSGGLDSSLIASIAARYLKKFNKKLKTFSIGLPGSTDEKYARMVAEYIGSDHTHIEMTEKEFIEAIEEVIYVTETFDITTIRASTGQYLISKWISKHTEYKVVLIGDGSDELCAGYVYFHNAPSPKALHEELVHLIKDIHLYDCLRADRGISSNGLEARVPFLDHLFVELYMSISAKLRMAINGVEKWLLRESFRENKWLPTEVLDRAKEAFSDGVSSNKKSWYQVIQEYADKIPDKELAYAQKTIKHCPPVSKEALYFRRIFEKYYGTGNVCKVIPYYWLPKWCGDIKEPSARVLSVYRNTLDGGGEPKLPKHEHVNIEVEV